MRRAIVLLFFACNACCSQGKKLFDHTNLHGMWISTLEGGYTYECPDAIKFTDDGKYVVYNDCEGLDITNPLVEKGQYKIKNDEISLYNRKFILDEYYFIESFGKEDIISFKIRKLKKDKLILCFFKRKDSCLILNYKKI